METAASRLRALTELSGAKESTVSWPAVCALGSLAERHFLAAVMTLEREGHGGHGAGCGGCDVLAAIDEEMAAS